MRNKTVITNNIMNYVVAISTSAKELASNEGEGMAILRGDAGSGKSRSSIFVAGKQNGCFIRA